MKPFHTIAVPHKDILEGKFTMEVYAAKLWDVYKNRGSDEYKDAKTFFDKTFVTNNFQKILDDVKTRLDGKGGNSYKHIETPFGGGKTHMLIALYHKCKEWNVKPVVLVGNEMDPTKETMWGMIEEQLEGEIKNLSGNVSHGGEALRKVLEKHQPVLILIDELLHYVVRASGINVGKTTLGAETIAFVQELSEAVSSIPNVCVVVTLPSSTSEQIDNEIAQELLQKLRKVSQRVEEKTAPITSKDVPNIIRARLFSTTDSEIRDQAEDIIDDFVDYCEDEGILPEGKQASEYREQIAKTYPFLPQVIDVLYERWGTIHSFQRTRGVLRLLSLVVGSLAKSDKSFISLADFDLDNIQIRRELVSHTDEQFDSVISKDITGASSGASKVNKLLLDSYKGLNLGTRAATIIFMYSFSGRTGVSGATDAEIKRGTCYRGIPSSIIGDVVNKFRDHLFFLNSHNEKYLFTKEANMLKMKMDRMENIKDYQIHEEERRLIEEKLGKQKLKVTVWPTQPKDVADTHSLKLVILQKNDIKLIETILKKKGESPRVYRNNILFLCPSDAERNQFLNSIKSKIAWEQISNDKIPLKDEQKTILSSELKKEKNQLDHLIKKYYRTLYLPEKDKLTKHDLGIPTISENIGIDDFVYQELVEEDQISDKLGPLFIKDHYLKTQDFVETNNLFESMLSTPGERRPVDRNVIEQAIRNGVIAGDFGLGELTDTGPVTKFFKNNPPVSFEPTEVIIKANICESQMAKPEVEIPQDLTGGQTIAPTIPESGEEIKLKDAKNELNFGFNIPEGKVSDVMGILLLLQKYFHFLKLQIESKDGAMPQNEIEKIKEALKQLGTDSDLQ